MSYILALTSLAAPEQDAQAWEWLETLKQQDDEEKETSPVLLTFYQVLTDMYPCLSSYAPGDTMREYSPWSDGPLINNFGHQLAVLGLSRNVERVTWFIVFRAKEMNITVFDEQTGTIHRPLPWSAAREPDVVAAPLQTLVKGQRSVLSKLVGSERLCMGIQAESPKFGDQQVWVNMACIGLDANGKLADERYMVVFDQPRTPCGAVEIKTIEEDLIGFSLDLQRLPASIERLLFTASVEGEGTLAILESGYVRLLNERGECARYDFTGGDFDDERALILAELYRKDGQWRFVIVAQGFRAGLDALAQHVGGSVVDPASIFSRLHQKGFGLRLEETHNEVLQMQLLRMPLEFSTAFAARTQLRMWGLLVPTPEEHQTGFWYWQEKARATHLLDVFMAVNFLYSHAVARLDGCNFSSAEKRAWALVAKASGMAGGWASDGGDHCACHAMSAVDDEETEDEHAIEVVCCTSIVAGIESDACLIAIVKEMNREIIALNNRAVTQEAYLQQPLWSGPVDPAWQQRFNALKVAALQLDAGFGFWIDWFEHICAGKPVDRSRLRLAAKVPPEIQSQGPAKVNAFLAGLNPATRAS